MRKFKSLNLIFGLLIVTGLLLAACGGASPASTPSQDTTSPDSSTTGTTPISAGDKITLKFWAAQNQSFNEADQKVIDKFMAQNPNIEIIFETFPYDQFIQTLQTAMTAGTEADVIELFGTWTCSYAAGGRLQEVPADVMTYSQAQEIFFQAPLDGYYCNDKLYGLPNEFNLENGGALVSPDLFAKHGVTYPPQWKTLADVLADASKLSEFEDGAMIRAGFHFTNDDALSFTFLAGILQQGGSYLAEDKKHFTFDTPEARQIAQLMVNMVQKDKVVDPVTFNGVTNTLPDAFFAGNVAIGFLGSWAAGEGRVNFPDTKFDYVTIPPYFGSENKFAADSGWGKVVSSHTQHAAEAWKFARFATVEQENALIFNTTTGTIPALKAIVAKPDEFLQAAPWVKPTFDLLPHGQYIGDVTDRDQLFYQIIAPHLLEALQGMVTVDEAIQKINTEANAMVDAKK